ncbi:MAG: Holliday junction resolvase RuvX [Candidatus Omnitrophica bacterium]|nr:Holliday junction resolvase RuvX [Candidatus Omnitrophota bacterium]
MPRILGLDLGERRIGVALSDPLGLTAQRLQTIEHTTSAQDLDAIAALVSRHAVGVIVVGLPLTMRGETGPQAQRVLSVVEALRSRVGCPVETVDERLTTAQGERALLATDASRRKRRQLIDQVAAQLILQAYLDATRT